MPNSYLYPMKMICRINRVEKLSLSLVLFLASFISLSCKKSGSDNPVVVTPPKDTTTTPVIVTQPIPNVSYWLTKNDGSVLLQKQTTALSYINSADANPTIMVDSTQLFQSIDGFGFTLTGGSAYVINQLDATTKSTLLKELFSNDSTSIGISYLRISIGASDLDASVFSYDDLPAGQTDANLTSFSIAKSKTDIVPILKDILAINPAIKIIATPWSPPVWMKDIASTKGGHLNPVYYGVYASYLVKYIQAMQAEGITIDAITPQNEPLNPYNNPSMVMSADEETSFIKTALGGAFQAAGITTKIIAYDHNCDQPDYPVTVLSDADAAKYVDGSAFHLYAGDISALTTVHNDFPAKNIYFTEQYTPTSGSFGGDLKWHLKNVIIGATRNWSRNALEWNLATDENFGPHTDGGCTTCKGALTVGSSVTRNVSYYIVAHAAKFIMPGSVRIASNVSGSLNNVAFKRPDGKKVLLVENDGDAATFNIAFGGKKVTSTLDAGAVATYVW